MEAIAKSSRRTICTCFCNLKSMPHSMQNDMTDIMPWVTSIPLHMPLSDRCLLQRRFASRAAPLCPS